MYSGVGPAVLGHRAIHMDVVVGDGQIVKAHALGKTNNLGRPIVRGIRSMAGAHVPVVLEPDAVGMAGQRRQGFWNGVGSWRVLHAQAQTHDLERHEREADAAVFEGNTLR